MAFRLLFLLPLLAVLLPAEGLPPLIDRELLFGNPEISGAQISPDGKFLAFIKPWKDTRNVWVKISAPYRNGAVGESFAKEAYPLLRNAYGLDRLLWGSDWPHTQFEATQNYARNRQFLDALIVDKDERAKVLASPQPLFRF